MNYNIEDIIQAIKTARKDRRLSQRDLSARSGIAQSHISKIENGSVDITLSTLVELARALDLEVMFVPRKLIPAVKSITKSARHDLANIDESRITLKELKKIEKALVDIKALPEAADQVQEFQKVVQELRKFRLPSDYLDNLREVTKTILAFKEGKIPVKELRKATENLKDMRNRLVHGVPDTPEPAYSLDDDNA